eukprot:TRINITY_DN153_c0_g1_i4.p1 TRINITY_DN153_c0_g1~~TRINITY_DN153_c0_g1_i4.p1  ORF type:complete len:247 (+),score=51.14 TRINITY_DN153_c0_g1_i4:77-742(+)
MAAVYGSAAALAGVSLELCASSKVSAPSSSKISLPKSALCFRASAEEEKTSRRAALSLIATTIGAGLFAGNALAVSDIKLEGPPPPIGGLPGTDSSDQARDTDAPLKERFYLQPKGPEEALARAKESAATLKEVKGLIEKKAWPYVQNQLRNEMSYLRLDLATVVGSKPKSEKAALAKESKKVFETIEALDYAARSKNQEKAFQLYAEAETSLASLLAKLG